jgi:hypothetical protein
MGPWEPWDRAPLAAMSRLSGGLMNRPKLCLVLCPPDRSNGGTGFTQLWGELEMRDLLICEEGSIDRNGRGQ